MDNMLTAIFNDKQSTNTTYVIDWLITVDVLGTPVIEQTTSESTIVIDIPEIAPSQEWRQVDDLKTWCPFSC